LLPKFVIRGVKHIQEMCKKGHKWADCLHSKPLRHADAWTSFSLKRRRVTPQLADVIFFMKRAKETADSLRTRLENNDSLGGKFKCGV
jgi:hypothetical protein